MEYLFGGTFWHMVYHTKEEVYTDIMEQDSSSQRDKILEQLEQLNIAMEKQRKVRYQVREGIIHGIGFFIGSVIIATILLGVLGPIFGKIQWVRDSYQAGEEILRP